MAHESTQSWLVPVDLLSFLLLPLSIPPSTNEYRASIFITWLASSTIAVFIFVPMLPQSGGYLQLHNSLLELISTHSTPLLLIEFLVMICDEQFHHPPLLLLSLGQAKKSILIVWRLPFGARPKSMLWLFREKGSFTLIWAALSSQQPWGKAYGDSCGWVVLALLKSHLLFRVL